MTLDTRPDTGLADGVDTAIDTIAAALKRSRTPTETIRLAAEYRQLARLRLAVESADLAARREARLVDITARQTRAAEVTAWTSALSELAAAGADVRTSATALAAIVDAALVDTLDRMAPQSPPVNGWIHN